MNNLREYFHQKKLNIHKITDKNKIRILDTDSGKFVIKENYRDHHDLYQYLLNKDFDYLLDRDVVDRYNIYPYVEEVYLEKEEKAIDLVYILSLLHNKTTFYRNVVLDKVKEIYEDTMKQINYLNLYYHDLQDVIEQRVYMSPADYLLIRNVSLIYSSLQYAKEKLESWYEVKINEKKERVVLLHNRVCLDHFLIGDKKSLISWDHYKRDIPIYDFLGFYRRDYLKVEMTTLFDIYQSRFLFTRSEKLLFLSLISIPWKVEFTKNHYHNCTHIYELIHYVEITRDFVLKQNQETKKEE